MVGSRCVVQGCSNKSSPSSGISLHSSPVVKHDRDLWIRFVRTHRSNFSPAGRFMVCSAHFETSCFSKALHIEGSCRFLSSGSIPTIWKSHPGNEEPKTRTNRKRRKVRYISRHLMSTRPRQAQVDFKTSAFNQSQ